MRGSLLLGMCLGAILAMPAQAQCTFGEAQRLMMQSERAFEQLQARDPQRARRVQAEAERRMASAMQQMPSGRVPSDDSPVAEAICDFWEDLIDLIED